ADDGREDRLLQRQVEVHGRDEDEDRDAEVQPQEERVDRSEHAQPLRHRLDSPLRRLHQLLPTLALTRSGSTGVIPARPRGHPGEIQATNAAQNAMPTFPANRRKGTTADLRNLST